MLTLENEKDLSLKGLSVIKFYAEWCAPCKRLDTLLKKMEKEFPDVVIYCVDVEKIPQLAKKYVIMSVPTLIFFNKEKEEDRVVGLVSTDSLRKSFNNYCK